MMRRRFGRTELAMPVLSCGGMRYQHKWQDAPLSEVPDENQRNLEATIRAAVASGINHIETARGYGSSERQLGLVLPTFPREELIVQTKVSPTETGEEFRRHFDESLVRLQLKHVDLLAIHGINTAELLESCLKPDGCLEAARQIQREGLARHIGFSTHAPTDMILAALQTEAFGGFDYVNLHWYYIFQDNWVCVEEATRRDIGVFIISPSDKGGMLYKPSETLCQLTAPLHPIAFNDVYCLMRPEVHTLSVGAARPTDFDLHLDAVKNFEQYQKLVPEIDARLQASLRAAMGDGFSWDHLRTLPPWDHVPGGVNLRIILWLLSLARSWDLVDYAKMRYNLLGNASHWFPGNPAGALEDLEQLRAVHPLPFAHDQVVAWLREADALLAGEKQKRLSQSST